MDTISLIIVCSVGIYVFALGMGMVIGQARGVRFVNRIARHVISWPFEIVGRSFLFLATQIRGPRPQQNRSRTH